jgi:hypothetical protein
MTLGRLPFDIFYIGKKRKKFIQRSSRTRILKFNGNRFLFRIILSRYLYTKKSKPTIDFKTKPVQFVIKKFNEYKGFVFGKTKNYLDISFSNNRISDKAFFHNLKNEIYRGDKKRKIFIFLSGIQFLKDAFKYRLANFIRKKKNCVFFMNDEILHEKTSRVTARIFDVFFKININQDICNLKLKMKWEKKTSKIESIGLAIGHHFSNWFIFIKVKNNHKMKIISLREDLFHKLYHLLFLTEKSSITLLSELLYFHSNTESFSLELISLKNFYKYYDYISSKNQNKIEIFIKSLKFILCLKNI